MACTPGRSRRGKGLLTKAGLRTELRDAWQRPRRCSHCHSIPRCSRPPFDEAPEALRAVESGHALGKIVIDLKQTPRYDRNRPSTTARTGIDQQDGRTVSHRSRNPRASGAPCQWRKSQPLSDALTAIPTLQHRSGETTSGRRFGRCPYSSTVTCEFPYLVRKLPGEEGLTDAARVALAECQERPPCHGRQRRRVFARGRMVDVFRLSKLIFLQLCCFT